MGSEPDFLREDRAMSPVSLAAPNSSGTAPPKLKAPAHAADCHIPLRFPDHPTPADASVADYRLLQRRIGYSRVVIVQPRKYATDNSVTLDAIKQLGISDARGIAVVRPSVGDAELKKLDE